MVSNAWDDLANRNRIAGYLDANLRGASQVFLQDNPSTGLMIIAAIFWGTHAAGNMEVAFGAVAGLVISTFVAILLHAEQAPLKQGLFGFNGILVGAAIPTYLVSHPAMWAFVVIGAAVSTIVTLAVANVAKTWGGRARRRPLCSRHSFCCWQPMRWQEFDPDTWGGYR